MLSAQTRLVPNAEEVAAKVIDGEAILINLSTGMYYSLDRAGGLVWTLVEAGCTLGRIAEALTAHFDVDADRAARDLDALAASLLEASLVKAVIENETPAVELPPPPASRAPYAPPALNAYHDMAELLALDEN